MPNLRKVKIANYLRKTERPLLKYLKKRAGKGPEGQVFSDAYIECQHILQKLHLAFGYDVLERPIKSMDPAQKAWMLRALQHYMVNLVIFMGAAGLDSSEDEDLKNLIHQHAVAVQLLDQELMRSIGDVDMNTRERAIKQEIQRLIGWVPEEQPASRPATDSAANATAPAPAETGVSKALKTSGKFADMFVQWFLFGLAVQQGLTKDNPELSVLLVSRSYRVGYLVGRVVRAATPSLRGIGHHLQVALRKGVEGASTGTQNVGQFLGGLSFEVVKQVSRFGRSFFKKCEDVLKFFGSLIVAAGTAVVALFKKPQASSSAGQATQTNSMVFQSHQAASHAGTSTSVGSAVHVFSLPLKVFLSLLYSIILLPTILKNHFKSWRNIFRGRKQARSASRLTSSWILGIGLAALGFFMPIGGPFTALAFGMFGLWAGLKLNKGISRYRARKKHGGCSNYEKWHLSSAELHTLVQPLPLPLDAPTPTEAVPPTPNPLTDITTTVYLLQHVGQREKVRSQQIKPHGYAKGSAFWFTNHVLGLYYKDTPERAASEKAIRSLKAAEIGEFRETMKEKLAITYADDHLSGLTNGYPAPAPSTP